MKNPWRVFGALLIALAASPAGARAQPMNAVLTQSSGGSVTLSIYRGKPVILFYEDRYSTHMNKPLKDELWNRAHEDKRLLSSAYILAVANLRGLNFFPAKNFALMRVSGLEKKVGIPILVDLDGTLSGPPWSLAASSSTVVLLDARGDIVFQKTGRLDAREIAAVFSKLEKLIGSS